MSVRPTNAVDSAGVGPTDGPAEAPSEASSPPSDPAAVLAAAIARFSTVLSALCVVAMLAVTALGVISREADTHLIRNHEEWSGYLMAAFAVTAMPGSFHANAWVRVDVILERVRGRARGVALRIFLTLTLGYAAALAWYSYHLASRSSDYGSHSVGGAEVALVLPQGAVAVGLLLFLAYMACRIASRTTTTGSGEVIRHE